MAGGQAVGDECGAVWVGVCAAVYVAAVCGGETRIFDRVLRGFGMVGDFIYRGRDGCADAAGKSMDVVGDCGFCGGLPAGSTVRRAVSVVGYVSLCLGRDCAACPCESLPLCSGRFGFDVSAKAESGDFRQDQSARLCADDLSAGGPDDLFCGHVDFADRDDDEDGDGWIRVCCGGGDGGAAEADGPATRAGAAVCVVSAAGVGAGGGGACGCRGDRVCGAGAAVPGTG